MAIGEAGDSLRPHALARLASDPTVAINLTTGAGGALLLERERELAMLDTRVSALVAGEAGALLVEGPAGIGKSRLVAEARRRAAECGARVLTARGGELETQFPFGVVRQLFEPLLADAELATRVLTGSASSARGVFDAFVGHTGADAADGSYSTLHGLYWLTVNLSSESPVLLAVDDLHWCDRPSLRFLAYLVRRLEGMAVLVVGSLRPSEPGADAALLAELAGDPLVESLNPGPLTEAAVAAVVQARLGDGVERAFARACHASTGGNPLMLNELLKALDAERVQPTAANVGLVSELGPRAASRAVLLRLARLSPDAVAVARSLAVLGDGADAVTVARLAGLAEPAAAEAGAALVRAEIVRSEPPLGFVHPLVRAAVYHDLVPQERALRHEQAAQVLAGQGAVPEQIAAHLLHAPARGDVTAVETLLGAAHAALSKGAPDSAVSALQRALEEPPPAELKPRVLAELGQAEALTYAPHAAAHLRDAYESLGEPVARARVADGLVRALLFIEEADEAVAIARRARQELPSEHRDLTQRLEALELLAPFFGARADQEFLGRLHAYRTQREGDGPGARMLAAIAAWGWTLDGGPAPDVVELALWALGDGVLLEVDAGLMAVVATIPLALADRSEALVTFKAIEAEAHRRGSVFTSTGRMLWGGFAALQRGELEEAEHDLRDSLETIALWGVPASAYSCGFVAQTAVERGALHEARAMLERSEVPPPSSDRTLVLGKAETALLLAEGRVEEAIACGRAFGAHAAWRRHPRYVPWRSLTALALDRAGRTEEALALAHEELEISRRIGAPGTVGQSLRVVGTIERERGHAYLEEAVEVLAPSLARLEHAKALAALGARLRRDRRPTEAREPLRRALELAESCGAAPLVDEVRAEIYATGARPRTAASQGVESLTASERRVALLAAQGKSNRDIAQELYVTPKTVEVHLSSAYRKLRITSRRDLVGVLEPR